MPRSSQRQRFNPAQFSRIHPRLTVYHIAATAEYPFALNLPSLLPKSLNQRSHRQWGRLGKLFWCRHLMSGRHYRSSLVDLYLLIIDQRGVVGVLNNSKI